MDKQSHFRIDNIFILIISFSLLIYLTVLNTPERNLNQKELALPEDFFNNSSVKYVCVNTTYLNDSTALCNIDDVLEVS